MRKILFLIFFSVSLVAMAGSKPDKRMLKQMKADIEAVKIFLKEGKDIEKNIEKNENVVRRYLADTLYSKDINLNVLLTDIVKKEYEIGNEKMFVNASVDTSRIVQLGRRMFIACQSLDSLDAMPKENGVSSPEYRKKNAEFLVPYRDNIFKGGLYFFAHRKWKESWQMMDVYLDCHRQPLFSETKLDSINDTYAAYVALVAANNLNDFPMTMKYAGQALGYRPAREVLLVMLSEMCRNHDDSLHYVKYLREGFALNSRSGYFFSRMVDYYTSKKDYGRAIGFTDEALSKDSLNEIFMLAKHSLLMAVKRYDEAVRYGEKVLEYNDTIAQPNYNVAYVLYKRAKDTMNNASRPYKVRMRDAQQFYRRCRPYMERYRRLRPEDKQRWYPVLYDVYLGLNLGKEFDELKKEK